MADIKKGIILIFSTFVSLSFCAQYYTGSNIQFGQNRVQYHDFFWQFYDFENFKVYFNAGGSDNAIYTAKSAERYIKELEGILSFDFDEKIEFVVFNSQAQYKESNIGLTNESESNIGGTTRIIGEKVFIYYEGDHDKLDRQIRSGIASIIAYKMMFGGNWREVLRNNSLLSLPSWYIDGFIAYMEGDWTTEIDNKVKSEVKNDLFDNLNRLTGEKGKLAGLAIWNYVAEVYGEKMIPNVLYMTRLSKNVESGFLYVLGSGLSSLSRDVRAYYNARYNEDAKLTAPITENQFELKIRKKYFYHNFTISPDKKYAAYATNELGQYKVWLYDIEKEKLKKIAKGEHKLNRLPDLSYPVLAWHPSSKALTFATEEKGDLLLNIYDVETHKNTPRIVPQLTKILSMNYNSDGKQIAMSAVQEGKTNIFVYNVIGGNKIQITNDIFDDIHPSFVENDTKIIFASNRIDDTIRKKVELKQYAAETDIYIIDIRRPDQPLQRITNTPQINEVHPYQYDDKNYTYLSDQNGIYNRYIAYYDSTISFIDTSVHYRYFSVADKLTNYPSNPEFYKVNSKNKSYSFMMRSEGTFKFYQGTYDRDFANEEPIKYTKFMQNKLKINNVYYDEDADIETVEINDDSNAVDINNYQFGDSPLQPVEKTNFEDNKTIVKIDEKKTPIDTATFIPFELPRQELYKINYANDYIVSQFDNSFLNETYQRLSPGGYINPGFNGIFKVGLKDLFEDYRIIAGFRYPVNFTNTEYLLAFENLKHRLDKKYLFSRRAFRENIGDYFFSLQNYEFKYLLKYPFSEVSAVRLTTNARYDRNVPLSTSIAALNAENSNDFYGGLKLEYIYDATINLATNINNGTRFKMWGEYMQQLNQSNGDFFTFGFDFRHYQKIHRTIVFASRVAASTSIGSQRLVYFMGGVDNWIGPKFDNSIQISPFQNYQFQTIATPMRGFHQNARNGNSFAVINNELRFPIFQYFAKSPLKSDFISNFMVIGFADVGTAWTGTNPYDLENSFNTTIVEGKNYQVILENQKEPIIYGYGGGLRTKIMGYYLRYDLAWGVDDGVVLKPVNYFSLSLDF